RPWWDYPTSPPSRQFRARSSILLHQATFPTLVFFVEAGVASRMHDRHTVDRRQMLFALTASFYAPFAAGQAPPPRTAFADTFLRKQFPTWSDADRTALQRPLAPENGGRINAQTVNHLDRT